MTHATPHERPVVSCRGPFDDKPASDLICVVMMNASFLYVRPSSITDWDGCIPVELRDRRVTNANYSPGLNLFP